MKKRKLLYYILIFLGSLQMIGLATGLKPVRGLGIASVASPLPLVFSHFRGVETSAADFFITLKNDGASIFKTQVTPEYYSQLKGPYNRRNIYGAVFAYGFALNKKEEQALVNSILVGGFCGDGPLVNEFNLSEKFNEVEIEVHTKTRGQETINRFGVQCP